MAVRTLLEGSLKETSCITGLKQASRRTSIMTVDTIAHHAVFHRSCHTAKNIAVLKLQGLAIAKYSCGKCIVRMDSC